MAKNNVKKLIEELLNSIDRVGLNKTIQSLETTQISVNEVQLLQEHIIILTCENFNISRKTLISGRKNIANRTNAISVCSTLLARYCKFSQTEIGTILRKEVSNINKYIKKFENLDEKFVEDRDILYKTQHIIVEIDKLNQLNLKT